MLIQIGTKLNETQITWNHSILGLVEEQVCLVHERKMEYTVKYKKFEMVVSWYVYAIAIHLWGHTVSVCACFIYSQEFRYNLVCELI